MHRGARIVEHGGAIDGFGASIRMLPDRKAAVVILVNKGGGSLPKTSERALELLAPLQPAAAPASTPIAMDGPEMAKYSGSYWNGSTRIDLTVRDGKLYFRRGAQEAEVVKIGPMRFSMTAPGASSAQTLALVPGADGSVVYLHTGSRALKRGPAGRS
jgi:hypothetical protein